MVHHCCIGLCPLTPVVLLLRRADGHHHIKVLGCEGKWVNLLIGNVFALTPVVFKFNRLLQQPNGYYLEGWMELPDGTWQQFGTVRPPYPASNIQVI